MSRIHLIAPASTLNKGDAAIYIGAINLITKYLPKCDISISIEGYGKSSNILRMFDSRTIKLRKGLLQGIKNSLIRESGVPKFTDEHSLSFNFLSQFRFFKFFHIPFLLAQTNKYLKLEPEPFNSIRESEAAVILGHNLGESSLDMFLLNYAVPKLLYKKKTIIFPISISAFQDGEGLSNNIRELYTRFVLRQMDCIMLREEYSFEFLREKLHIYDNIALVADTAFFLPKEDFQDIEIKKPALAVCVRGGGYFQEYEKYIHASYSLFIRNLAKTLDDLINRLGINIYFVPMTIYPHINFDKYDYDGALRVFGEMKQKNKAYVINTWNMTPGEIASLIERMDFVLTMRLHQAIVAATVGTPSALILAFQDKKGIGIMKSLGLGDYFIDLGLPPPQLNRNILAKVVEGFNNRVSLKRVLNSRLPSIKRKAVDAVKILAITIEK